MEDPEFVIYKPSKLDDMKAKYINSSLPKPPFRMVLVGQTGSGKTQLIMNMLFSKGFYRDYFEQIYVWCGSADDCEEYERISEEKKYRIWNDDKEMFYKTKKEDMSEKVSVSKGVDEDDLLELLDSLESEPITDDDATLWVFDDMIVSKLLQSKGRMNVLDEAFIRGRHIGRGLSLLISTQKYRQLNQNMRTTNTSHLVIYHGISKLDLQAISQESSGILSPEQFNRMFNDVVNKKYKFLIIFLRNEPDKMFMNSQFKFIDINKYL